MNYVTGEYYHVYNRGVDKRTIFLGDADYRRFLESLSLFNTLNTADHTKRIINGHDRITAIPKQDCLVKVVDFCLMPNHYHLILKQLQDGGISKFTQKISIGYTEYFNLKRDRSGVLFQGRTKKKHVNSNEYLQYLIEYVYFNPIDLIESGWKEKGVQDIERIIKFLDEYKWTSGSDHRQYFEFLK